MKEDVGLHGPFGLGPWSLEPDEKTWVDRYTGYRCVAIRHTELGHWCGYVVVPWDRTRMVELPGEGLRVHGGVTYEADRGPGEPVSNEPTHRWFGFDCGHAWDLVPGMAEFRDEMGERLFRHEETYRTLEFVENECRGLAAQIKEKLQ
jgi:hypothetical protein